MSGAAHHQHKFDKLLHSIGAYKRKLQEQGLINSIDEQMYGSASDDDERDSNDVDSLSAMPSFSEMEMLELMPVIIGELRSHRIEPSERSMLHRVYGNLWPLMEAEAERRNRRRTATASDKRRPAADPVLKELLRAQRDRDWVQPEHVFRRAAASAAGNANAHSSAALDGVAVDEQTMAAKLARLWTDQNGNVEPSQRILKLAAIMIHEHMMRREHHRAQRRSLRRRTNAAVAAAREAAKIVKADRSEAAVLRVRVASRSKRAAIDIAEQTAGNTLDTATGANDRAKANEVGDDADYEYWDAEDESAAGGAASSSSSSHVKDMYDDAVERNAGGSDSDSLDPTLLALRGGNDEELLRQLYGPAPTNSGNSGAVSELFHLAEQHRQRMMHKNVVIVPRTTETAAVVGSNDDDMYADGDY